MLLKGQIQAILRDALTGEIAEDQTVDNIVTEHFYYHIRDTFSVEGMGICINSKAMTPSRWNQHVPGNFNGGFALNPDTNIPSIGAPLQFFSAAGSTPAYLQFSGRYNPPSADRTLKTVLLLGGNHDQGTLNYPAGIPACTTYAYAPLATPCTQTTTQVLDVYYRIFFPLDASTNMSPALVTELFSRYLATNNLFGMSYHTVYPTPIASIKPGDELLSAVAQVAHSFSYAQAFYDPNTTTPNDDTYGTRRLARDAAFAEAPGTIYAAIVTGGADQGYNIVNSSGTDQALPVAFNNFVGTPKIQNLIGHGTTAKANNASPWLDVDNLPAGTGVVQLGGTWNNRSVPSSPGLYAPAKLPRWDSINIVTSGQESDGSAAYNYTSMPFFGSYVSFSGTNPYGYSFMTLPNLCATAPVSPANPGYWQHQTWDAGQTIVEAITQDKFDVQQLSSSMRYDDNSFVLVKRDKVILYNIGSGEYWKFNAAYTNISQIAVVAGLIYIGCRDTGLWVIDPANSLNVVHVASPSGLDLSVVYGVHEGYSNSVVVVGANGIGILTAGTWTVYNSTSTPAFSATGVSDGNYSNVAFLKVDTLSPMFQMLLVRTYNATVNPTSIGVWWSTATAALDGFVENAAQTYYNGYEAVGLLGRPRVNRTHIGGHDGLWAMSNGQQYVMAFGASPNLVDPTGPSGGLIGSSQSSDTLASVYFVKNSAGQTRLLTQHEQVGADASWNYHGYTRSLCKLSDVTGNITESSQSELWCNAQGLTPFGTYGARARASAAAVGYADGTQVCASSFLLSHGVMVTLWVGTENGPYDYGQPGYVDNLLVCVSNYALDGSLSGGALAYLAKTTYGWNSTTNAWDATITTPKPVHSAPGPLFDGVTVTFTDGSAGQSFSTPNYYKFGLCEGILKDNATQYHMGATYYFRRTFKNTTLLTAATVPAVAALPTGAITLTADPTKFTTGATVDSNGHIVFPGEAGLQYGFGDKQVSGDFQIDYDCTDLTAPETTSNVAFGVGKKALSGTPQFGFIIYAGILYGWSGTNVNTNAPNLNVPLSTVTEMAVRRLGGVLQLLVNGAAVFTDTPSVSGIRAGDQRLETVFSLWGNCDPSVMIPNNRLPLASISVNGSDGAVFVGDGVSLGAAAPRFFAVDTDVPGLQQVTIGGVAAVVKGDGTAPAQGECAIDGYSGALYFNALDVGAAITALISYQQTE
jgi:hypothetical protein